MAKHLNTVPHHPQHPVMQLPLASIILDANTQTRVAIDEHTVADYAADIVKGNTLPVIVVFQHESKYYLADGFHRFYATRLAKNKTISCEVRQGTRLAALEYSLGQNWCHGLRRNNADKRFAATLALKEFSAWSDNRDRKSSRRYPPVCCNASEGATT